MTFLDGRRAQIPAVDRILGFTGTDCQATLWNMVEFGRDDPSGRFIKIHPVNQPVSFELGFRARAIEVVESTFQCPSFTRDNGGRCLPQIMLPEPVYVPSGPPVAQDQDRDGLHDAIENQLAMAFRPIYYNDSGEDASRQFAYTTVDGIAVAEPVTLFEVAPIGTDDIVIRYMRLWHRDISNSTFCRGHLGDSQRHAVHLRTTRTHRGRFWWVRQTTIGINRELSWRQNENEVHNVHFEPGPMTPDDHPPRHLAIFFSRGKHHEYADTSSSGQPDLKCPNLRARVDGRATGRLAPRLAILRSPLNAGDRYQYTNVGSRNHPFFNDLSPYGYADQCVWRCTRFYTASPACNGFGGFNQTHCLATKSAIKQMIQRRTEWVWPAKVPGEH